MEEFLDIWNCTLIPDRSGPLSQGPTYFASGQRHSGIVSKYLELHFDLRSPLSQGPGS